MEHFVPNDVITVGDFQKLGQRRILYNSFGFWRKRRLSRILSRGT